MITARKCPACGESFKDDWQYCPKCGKYVPITHMRVQMQDTKDEVDTWVDEAKLLYFNRKYKAAWDKCMLAADMDDGEAYFMLGLLTARGHHGYRNVKSAITWYTKGLEKNNAAATNAVGVMYYKGNPVEKDLDLAIAYFKKATELGDMMAPYNLARCYEYGLGVPKDKKKAQEFFVLAIERGNDHAGDYFERIFFNTKTNEVVQEDEPDAYGYVLSKERWGYMTKTVRYDNATVTINVPIYNADYYKKNAEWIKRWEDNYRRGCMYRLPELIVM